MTIFSLMEQYAKRFQEMIGDGKLSSKARIDKNSFQRNRLLTCARLLTLIISGIRLPLQLATDNFFKAIGMEDEAVSKQAVSKARTNLDPNIIKEQFIDTASMYCECDDIKLWKNKYRLCATDGSDVALDNAAPLKEHFGCSGRGKTAATAMLSMCYDPLNNFILDASLNPYKTDERTAARTHIANVSKLPKPEGIHNLFINDRGYPSKEFIAELMDGGHVFLMRVRRKFNLDFDAVKLDDYVTFEVEGKPYRVRVIKVALDSGEIETLVTNLSVSELPTSEAGELYFTRWGIETKYNSLKNKLQLENFSGRRVVTVMQDFWATMYLANFMASVECKTDAEIAANNQGKTNKHEQKTNENRLIHKFKRDFFECLLEPCAEKRLLLFDNLVKQIAKRPTEVKPGRTSERKNPRKSKFHDRYKSVV